MSVANRQEILFIYEAKDCNPNGDPLDENKPRTDPETGVATVTDVRIKRTVRDYLHQVKGQEILPASIPGCLAVLCRWSSARKNHPSA